MPWQRYGYLENYRTCTCTAEKMKFILDIGNKKHKITTILSLTRVWLAFSRAFNCMSQSSSADGEPVIVRLCEVVDSPGKKWAMDLQLWYLNTLQVWWQRFWQNNPGFKSIQVKLNNQKIWSLFCDTLPPLVSIATEVKLTSAAGLCPCGIYPFFTAIYEGWRC